ncbi:MAG: response regulator [Candidatus Latescibacteria bacterium]|nr:response regulator [Candidatus Latescibacterota bacterium]
MNAILQDARILLVDDQPTNLDVLSALLEREGCRLHIAPNGRVALKVVHQMRPDLILLDVVMPGMDGFEVCRQLKAEAETAAIPVVFITARDLTENVVDGFDVGGVDYITKPFQDKEVLARLRTHLNLSRLNRELLAKNRALEEEIAQRQKLKGRLSQISAAEADRWGLEELIGDSPTMQQIFKDIRLLRENDTTVLVTGESGTGKELIARALHYGSPRRDGPFVPVNCSALPRELAESLLFGHLKGSFTGADSDRAVILRMPTKARFSWTKWVSCRWSCNPNCCVCSKTARCSGWAPPNNSGWMCAWWRRPMSIWLPASTRGPSVLICTTAWPALRWWLRPCASGARIFRCWPGICCTNWPRKWAATRRS